MEKLAVELFDGAQMQNLTPEPVRRLPKGTSGAGLPAALRNEHLYTKDSVPWGESSEYRHFGRYAP